MSGKKEEDADAMTFAAIFDLPPIPERMKHPGPQDARCRDWERLQGRYKYPSAHTNIGDEILGEVADRYRCAPFSSDVNGRVRYNG